MQATIALMGAIVIFALTAHSLHTGQDWKAVPEVDQAIRAGYAWTPSHKYEGDLPQVALIPTKAETKDAGTTDRYSFVRAKDTPAGCKCDDSPHLTKRGGCTRWFKYNCDNSTDADPYTFHRHETEVYNANDPTPAN